MDKLINFYNENKELIQLIAIAIVWFFTHRQVAINFAKKKASTFIFAAEKYSEQLMLNVGSEKMDYVVSEGYKLLPSWVRPFVSMDTFRNEAQKLFNLAKNMVETSVSTQTTQTTQTTSTPVTVAKEGATVNAGGGGGAVAVSSDGSTVVTGTSTTQPAQQ